MLLNHNTPRKRNEKMRDFEVQIVVQADSADEALNKAMIMGPDITFAYVTDSADASREETIHCIKKHQE